MDRFDDEKEVDIMMSTKGFDQDSRDVSANLEVSLKEVKLMREGKKAKRSWKDFRKRLEGGPDGE